MSEPGDPESSREPFDGLDDEPDPDFGFYDDLDRFDEATTPSTRTTSWSPHRAVDVQRVELIAGLLARWELGSVHRLRAAARHAVSTEAEYLVLSELAVRPDGLTGAALSGLVGLGSGGMSDVLMRLEEQELIERGPDPEDRRSMVATATDAGRQFVRDEAGDVADLRGVATLVDGLRRQQMDLIVEFLGNATNRAYRQTQHLRDVSRRRR